MEYLNPLSQGFTNRMQSQYLQINDSINRLIEQLGLSVQKQLVTIEEKTLLQYKDTLLSTQNSFKGLKQERNDEAIKQNIINMKIQQEKAHQQSTEKSLEMNKIYEKLKVQYKRTGQYARELQLELKFLSKQCKMAKIKSESLDEEIRQFQERRMNLTIRSLQKSQSSNKFTRNISREEENGSQLQNGKQQRRIREKIENLRQYLTYISEQDSTLEKIISKYDYQSLKTERQKTILFSQLFEDKQFKKFVYKILFENERFSSRQQLKQ